MSTVIPRISEKAFKLSTDRRTYVFNVPLDMNRTQVAAAVASEYSVKVESVKIAIVKGKAVRFIRKGGRVNTGVRADVKKAYVRLAEGQSLPIFAAVEENIKEAEKAETAEKPDQKKRGLFGRKAEKATKTSGASAQVTRTQAKVGEK